MLTNVWKDCTIARLRRRCASTITDRSIAGLIRSARQDIVSMSKIDSAKVKRLVGVFTAAHVFH